MNSTSKSPKATGGSADSAPQTAGRSSSDRSASSTRRRLAGTLLEIVDSLRDACNDQELPAQFIAVLLHVANRGEPPSVLEVGELAGMSKASSSRLVQILGRGMRDRPGLGLLETVEDPTNWSRKLVKLSPKGVRLMNTIEDKLLKGMRRISLEA